MSFIFMAKSFKEKWDLIPQDYKNGTRVQLASNRVSSGEQKVCIVYDIL